MSSQSDNSASNCRVNSLSPPHKISRMESTPIKSASVFPLLRPRDEFAVFGEYIANELRSLKGEKNLLVAKKKIQDAIFDVKMSMIRETKMEQGVCTVFTSTSQAHNATTIHDGKIYATPALATTEVTIEHLSEPRTPPSAEINEIMINGSCHYTNFKVDTQ